MDKTAQKTVFIRADGSKSIGMGHLSRAALLSGLLKRRFGLEPLLLVRDDPAAARFLADRKAAVQSIPADLSIDSEIDHINAAIARERPALMISDVLTQEERPGYLAGIKRGGIPLVAITDDSHYREFPADLVINGNPNQLGLDYGANAARYRLGPKYFIMDPDNSSAMVKEPGQVKTILLTFGGSDHNDLAFKVLAGLAARRLKCKVMLIVSSASGYLDRLRDRLKDLSEVELVVDVPGLAPYWSQADLAVTAGGNTLFERIASRLPGATICQLERQMEIADKFAELGVNVNLGFGPRLSEQELTEGLMDLITDQKGRLRQYELAPDVVDGLGLNRLGDEIEKLLIGG